MAGSPAAAETANGEGAATRRGALRRCFFVSGTLALLAGCTAATPPLAGLSAQQVVALLGEPDLRRAEPPAELWQYRRAGCVLDLFLYGDAASAHVVHSEARERGFVQGGQGVDDCRIASRAAAGIARPSQL